MPKITLKRITNADGTNELLYPTTTLDQIISEGTGPNDSNGDPTDESLSAYLSSTYVAQSSLGAASGVATLDSDSKVPLAQMPDAVFGSLIYRQAVNSGGDAAADAAVMVSALDSALYNAQQEERSIIGSYFIVNNNSGTMSALTTGTQASSSSFSTAPYFRYTFKNTDSGVASANTTGASSGTVESGDWLVVEEMTGDGTSSSSPYFVKLAVINNKTESASESVAGIARLIAGSTTNAAPYDATNNPNGVQVNLYRVLTDRFLYYNTASGDLNSGTNGAYQASNKLALTNHNHDGIYYTKSFLNDVFDGDNATTINGYNRANWDTAYGWGDHSTAGYLTSETSHADVLVDGDFGSAGLMKTNGSGTYSIVTDNSSNWDTAYGWGDHSTYTDPVKFLNGNIPSSGNTVGTIFLHQDS